MDTCNRCGLETELINQICEECLNVKPFVPKKPEKKNDFVPPLGCSDTVLIKAARASGFNECYDEWKPFYEQERENMLDQLKGMIIKLEAKDKEIQRLTQFFYDCKDGVHCKKIFAQLTNLKESLSVEEIREILFKHDISGVISDRDIRQNQTTAIRAKIEEILKEDKVNTHTQQQRILKLLRNRRWISLKEILNLRIAQYNTRILELRKRYVIENKTKQVGKVKYSWYKLIRKIS